MKRLSIVFFLVMLFTGAFAQTKYSISGHIKNAKGYDLESVTVFLNGSKQYTRTDNKGVFEFKNISPGTFELVSSMLGYSAIKQNVIVQDKNMVLNIAMQEKTNILKEVVIGDGSQRAEHLKIFVRNFLGESKNAKECKILDTDLLDFSTNKRMLNATTNDFLIIDNKALGYRIKYLLRNFQYNMDTQVTSYDGECIFENLDSTDEQQLQWKSNRERAYLGSLMHYLRSLYTNSLRKEGFLTYGIVKNMIPYVLNPTPINMEQYIFTIDNNFIELKFDKRFVVFHNPKKAAKEDTGKEGDTMVKSLGNDGSDIRLYLSNAILDKKGSYVDYRSFFIRGFWGRKRIGDQLPFEYQPGD